MLVKLFPSWQKSKSQARKIKKFQEAYSEPFQLSKINFVQKIFFRQKLHFRCLTGFQIRFTRLMAKGCWMLWVWLQLALRVRDCRQISLLIILSKMVFVLLFIINSLVPNAPFLHLLKTSENHKLFWCFQGAEKGCIGYKWVNIWMYR